MTLANKPIVRVCALVKGLSVWLTENGHISRRINKHALYVNVFYAVERSNEVLKRMFLRQCERRRRRQMRETLSRSHDHDRLCARHKTSASCADSDDRVLDCSSGSFGVHRDNLRPVFRSIFEMLPITEALTDPATFDRPDVAFVAQQS